MLVPRYWAEARRQHRDPTRQLTVRRFGWSSDSPEAAERHAGERADAALAQALAGERLEARERKVPYNGADGLPIREEVLEVHGEAVVTRNSYGARCLNTPDVLLADVDFAGLEATRGARLEWVSALAALVVLGALWLATGDFGVAALGGFAVLVALTLAWNAVTKRQARRGGGVEGAALERVRAFARQHPEWRLHVYRTPAGLRLIAGHRRFDPLEPAVKELFDAVGVDPMYARMCALQRCFRARLTAKPWRLGLTEPLRPRPGVWPVRPERLPERARWVAAYEAKAREAAACRYLETLGQGAPDGEAERLRRLHDEACRAQSALPLA